MTTEDLRSIELFYELDEAKLAELAAAGSERSLAAGEWLFEAGEKPMAFFILLEGRLESVVQVEGGIVPTMTHEPGGFIGAIGVLTGDPYAAGTRAIERSRVGLIRREDFRRLMFEVPAIDQRIMRVFAPVYQRVEALNRDREKMAALGTMAAGLAHELNNPAAAARRSAGELADALEAIQTTLASFVESGVEREDAARFVALQREVLARAGEGGAPALDPLEAADREDALLDWLERREVPEAWRLAPELVAAGIDAGWLDRAGAAAGAALPAALNALVAALSARGLADELRESTARMSALVGAMREYTYMDRAPQNDVDIHHGLETTLTILGHKLKRTEIRIERRYDPDLPPVPAWGSELNQVWTNLLDNAIDALGDSGTITLETGHGDTQVRVSVADDGPGIPPEVQPRVFEPFFTTKAPGAGTGLGLETTWRIVVERHRGDLRLESRPGDTRFTVTLPLASPAGRHQPPEAEAAPVRTAAAPRTATEGAQR